MGGTDDIHPQTRPSPKAHVEPARTQANARGEQPLQDQNDPNDQPRVWLILGDKGGDNGQALRVAQALGWRFERKHVHMREPYIVGKPRVKASLHHIDLSRSDPLEKPWPDLIITVGRRPSSAALWVRVQSGGHSKIVLLGKPSGPIEWFDLVIASAENAMPPLTNIVSITLPLMAIDPDAIAGAAERWRPRFADLPRPLIGILVGGSTGQVAFDRAVVSQLIDVTHRVTNETGGTVCLTTSRRTPESAVSELRKRLPPGSPIFPWTPDSSENPYQGLLALADGFVVTGDSISMLVEVVRARKPVAIFPIPVSGVAVIDQWRRAFIHVLFSSTWHSLIEGLRQPIARLLYRLRLATPTRDFLAFHQLLIEHGLAVPLGKGFPQPKGKIPNDLPKVVASIKSLFKSH